MARKNIIPLAAMEKLMRKHGAVRVSETAKQALSEALEEHAAEISNNAMTYAKHAGRKTVTSADIKLASKQ